MKVFKYSRFLIAVIVIGLVAALMIDVQRHHVETANTRVDMAIDYEGLQELAQREGLPEKDVLAQAKEAGIGLFSSGFSISSLSSKSKPKARLGSFIPFTTPCG